jgi:hypothetical protein
MTVRAICLVAICLLGGTGIQDTCKADNISVQFKSPPEAAKPWTWWHWMSGNITRAGISRDLEAMKKQGLGGAVIFNVNTVTAGPVKIFSPEWQSLLKHAAAEADRIGIKLSIENCAGWSTAAGPWITPEKSMQQLSWSETDVSGPAKINLTLPKPFARSGYYQDIDVLAFPTPADEGVRMGEAKPRFTVGGKAVPGIEKLTDGDHDSALQLDGELLLEFPQPFTARALNVVIPRLGLNEVELSAAADDGVFKPVATLKLVAHTPFAGCLGSVSFAPVTARTFKISVRDGKSGPIGEVELLGGHRLNQWPAEACFTEGAPPLPNSIELVVAGGVIARDGIRDLSAHLDGTGRLNWEVPPGRWTIMRIGSTTTGIKNFPAAEEARGLELDKCNPAAADLHVDNTLGRFVENVGPELFKRVFTHYFIDSYESGYQNWSPVLPGEFSKRRGYDLRSWLPAMTGRIINSPEESRRFLWDLRRTIADCYADHFYGRFDERARQFGIEGSSEAYGGPYDFVQCSGRGSLPVTEFWCEGSVGRDKQVFAPACAGHLYGRPIIGAEAFTSGSLLWQQYPGSLKTLGDFIYASGVNRFIFHRFAHQPWTDERIKPGMTLGGNGLHFDRSNTWWDPAHAWIEYLTRCQTLLQHGLYAADALYLMAEGERFSGGGSPRLPAGYDFDVASAEVVMQRLRVEKGRLVLPDGMNYRYLVLPDHARMTPELLKKIRELIKAGATVIGSRPKLSPSLSGYPGCDAALSALGAELWGADGAAIGERRLGQGRLIWGKRFEDILATDRLAPDFACDDTQALPLLHAIHRRNAEADLYFVAWAGNDTQDITCRFRCAGKIPELWHPDTGLMSDAPVWEERDGVTSLPLRLTPGASVFVVFRKPASKPVVGIPVITSGGRQVYPWPVDREVARLTPGSRAEAQKDFTVAFRVKPSGKIALPAQSREGVSWGGQDFAVYPAPGHSVWGNGQAGLGISVGQNGIAVFEHAASHVPALLVHTGAVRPWSHLAIVVTGNRPALYVDGKHVATGLASAMTLHASTGVTCSQNPPGYAGKLGAITQVDRALAAGEIAELAAVPFDAPPEKLPPVELISDRHGEAVAAFAVAGDYQIRRGQIETSITVKAIPEPMPVTGPWRISFPTGWGAPESATFDRLISWTEHPEAGIRYFSGTAVYRKTFDSAVSHLTSHGLRISLDLGRVEVIAEVWLNGKSLGTLWKPPFSLDITDSITEGANELEVRVTNLWVNRLIGDEQYPPDAQYNGASLAKWPDWLNDPSKRPEPRRVTFAPIKPYGKDSPLFDSGLIGPVMLKTVRYQKLPE